LRFADFSINERDDTDDDDDDNCLLITRSKTLSYCHNAPPTRLQLTVL